MARFYRSDIGSVTVQLNCQPEWTEGSVCSLCSLPLSSRTCQKNSAIHSKKTTPEFVWLVTHSFLQPFIKGFQTQCIVFTTLEDVKTNHTNSKNVQLLMIPLCVCVVHICNSFIEIIHISCNSSILKRASQLFFSIFVESYNYRHYLISEHCLHSKSNFIPIHSHCCSPPPPAPSRPLIYFLSL